MHDLPCCLRRPALVQELDVQGQLAAANAAVDRLAKQVALLGRDQEVRHPGRWDPGPFCCRPGVQTLAFAGSRSGCRCLPKYLPTS